MHHIMKYTVHGEELSSGFLNSFYFISVMMSLSDYLQLLTKQIPRGALKCRPCRQPSYQCLETFHMQFLDSAGDGWHLWIWLQLLVEPTILGKAKES